MAKLRPKGKMGSTRQGSPYPSSRSNWVSVNYRGWEVFEKEIGEQINELAQEVVRGNLEQTLHIAKSTAPRDTGKLEQSGSLVVFDQKNSIGGMIGFSATNPRDGYDYAYIQEVNEDYNHIPGRKAHYLRDAWNQVSKDFPGRIKKAVGNAARRATSKADMAHKLSQPKTTETKAAPQKMAPEPSWMRTAAKSPVKAVKGLFQRLVSRFKK